MRTMRRMEGKYTADRLKMTCQCPGCKWHDGLCDKPISSSISKAQGLCSRCDKAGSKNALRKKVPQWER